MMMCLNPSDVWQSPEKIAEFAACHPKIYLHWWESMTAKVYVS